MKQFLIGLSVFPILTLLGTLIAFLPIQTAIFFAVVALCFFLGRPRRKPINYGDPYYYKVAYQWEDEYGNLVRADGNGNLVDQHPKPNLVLVRGKNDSP